MVEVQVLHSISFDTWGNDSLLQLGAGDEISGSSTRLKLKPFWLDGVAVPHFCYHMASTDTTGVVVEGGFFTVGWWWQSWLPTSPSLTLPQHRVGMALCYCLLGGNLGFPHGFHQYLKEGVPMTTFQKWKFQLPSWPSLMATHGVLGVPCECLMWVKIYTPITAFTGDVVWMCISSKSHVKMQSSVLKLGPSGRCSGHGGRWCGAFFLLMN